MELVTGGELFDKIVRRFLPLCVIWRPEFFILVLFFYYLLFCCFFMLLNCDRLAVGGWKKMKQENIFSSLYVLWITVIVEVFATET